MSKASLKALIGIPKNLDQANQIIDLLLETVATQREQLDSIQDNRTTNSSNSSKPPSSDTPEERQQRPSKPATGRQPGGQSGHKGHHRRLHPPEEVTHVHHWYPDRCNCGGSIRLTGQSPYLKQFVDLPVMKAVITEHHLHHGCCTGCGASHYAPLPNSVTGSTFGPELHATVALLSAQFRMSDRLIQTYLKTFYALPISLGSISNLQGRVTPLVMATSQSGSRPH